MSFTFFCEVAFGASKTGLATVGFALYNSDGTLNTARATAGVTERGTFGTYGVVATFPDLFIGEIRWDTGEAIPTYASEIVRYWESADLLVVKTQTDKMQFDVSNNIKSTPQTDSTGVTTLLGRLTDARAAYLDLINSYLDRSVNAVYSLVNSVKAKTDVLPADPASQATTNTSISNAQTAILADTALIKAKTNNLPASPAAVGSQMDLVNAPNATAIAAIQSGLALASNLTTVLNRLGAITGSGRNTILGMFQALFRSDADATVPTDINTNLGGGAGTADNTLHSTQAIRNRGDAAWGASGAPSAVTIANQVWDTARSAHTTAGTFGEGVATVQGNITGSVASVTGNVSGSVASVVGNVGGSINGNLVGNVQGTVNDSSGITTLLSRITSARAGYLDALAGWTGTLKSAIQALARKDAAVNSDIGGTHLPSTDSEEALREKLDTLSSAGTTTENVTVNELGT